MRGSEGSALAQAFGAVYGDAGHRLAGERLGRDALAAALKIDDVKLVQALFDLGITSETLAALWLVPLVVVAWADGSVAPEERREIIRAARETGLIPGGAYHRLVEHWIQERPSTQLMAAWKAYVGALSNQLPPETYEALKTCLLERAEAVANAEGPRAFGVGSRTSRVERGAIEQLRAALEGSEAEGPALGRAFFAVYGDAGHRLAGERLGRDALAAALKIDDVKLIQALFDLGITSETLAALWLVPLVVVAWADGSVALEERTEIIRAARETGLVPGDAYHQLIERWIQQEPTGDLIGSWTAYIRALSRQLAPETYAGLRECLLERAEAVARAAGPRALGVGSRTSRVERGAIEQLRAAFG